MVPFRAAMCAAALCAVQSIRPQMQPAGGPTSPAGGPSNPHVLHCHCPSLLDCSCTHPPPPHYDDAVQYAERARQVVKHARAEMLTDRFVTALAGGEGRSLLLSLVGRELAARRKRHDDINLLLDAANSNA